MSAHDDDGDARSVEEHLAEILAAVAPLTSAAIPLASARGRVLAHPVISRTDLPGFDNSAMDGYALRRDDAVPAGSTPARVRIVAELPAGTALDPELRPGEAARIMTGAALPSDADAVVPFEHAETTSGHTGDEVAVLRAPAKAAHVRRRGEDIRAGEIVVPAGVGLGAWQLAAIAAAGVPQVTVSAVPEVAIVSTGAELRPAGSDLRRGEIFESNGELIAALVVEAGGRVLSRTVVGDDPRQLRSVIDAATASGADAVVMSGGLSAGAYEPVRQGLAAEMHFGAVAMQPGRPQGFGTRDRMLLFGLPGNPVAVAVSFEVFVRPALLAQQGVTRLDRPRLSLAAAVGWRSSPGRTQYLPAAIDRSDPARWTVAPAGPGGSRAHLIAALARAEALAVVPAAMSEVAPGDEVDVMMLT